MTNTKRRMMILLDVFFVMIFITFNQSLCYASSEKLKNLIGGEKIRAGTKYKIKWSVPLDKAPIMSDKIYIYLWNGQIAEWVNISEEILLSTGYYIWNIPGDLHGDRFRIKLVNCGNYPIIYDMSESYFSIIDNVYSSSQGDKKVIKQCNQFDILSNPIDNKSIIISSKNLMKSIVLRNYLGAEVFHFVQEGINIEIPISKLANGVYFVEVIFSDNCIQRNKFIVKK